MTIFSRTYHKRTARRFIAATMAAVTLAGTGIAWAGDVHAQPQLSGCEDMFWFVFLRSSRRLICDTPIRPDGSWDRTRVMYTPAHRVPFTCSTYGGYYSSSTSCSGGYDVDLSVAARETYPVTAGTVLPDEPGHLDNGQVIVR